MICLYKYNLCTQGSRWPSISLQRNTIYSGSHGQYTVDYNNRKACYWTVSTNGGTAVETTLSAGSGYGGAINSIAVDGSGNVWAIGNNDGEYPVYYYNGTENSLGNNAWNTAYSVQLYGGSYYISVRSNNCYWIDINGTSVIPTAGDNYAFGMVVTNSVIYAASDLGGGSLLISSNNGSTWNQVTLPNGVPMGNGGAICFDNGTVYICGSTASSPNLPCYWTVTSNGIATQINLQHQQNVNGRAQDISVFDGSVYVAGTENISGNGVSCYWIGTNQYILDPGDCEVYGAYSGLIGILAVH